MDYHCLGDNENRPVRWMALESLVNNEFSSASDVVSCLFGFFPLTSCKCIFLITFPFFSRWKIVGLNSWQGFVQSSIYSPASCTGRWWWMFQRLSGLFLHGKIVLRVLFSLVALAEKAIKFSEQSVLGLVCYLNERDPESTAEYFSWSLSDREKRGRIASLDLLATLMLTQCRMQLCVLLQGPAAHAFNFFTKPPRSFSAKPLSRWLSPASSWSYSLTDAGLCICFPWTLGFLSAHFSSFWRSFCRTLSSSLSTTLLRLVSSTSFLKVQVVTEDKSSDSQAVPLVDSC